MSLVLYYYEYHRFSGSSDQNVAPVYIILVCSVAMAMLPVSGVWDARCVMSLNALWPPLLYLPGPLLPPREIWPSLLCGPP